MYTSWRNSIGDEGSSEKSTRQTSSTLVIPATVRRWNLPAKLIRQPVASESSASQSGTRREKPVQSSVWPEATAAQQRLASGFERLLRLLMLSTHSDSVPVLTRDDLLSAADAWSSRLSLTRIRMRQLRRLAGELWILLESLTVQKGPPAGCLPITPASIAAGLRKRVQTRLDFLTLRRSLLRLAADSFALLSEAGLDTAWTPQLLEVLQFVESAGAAAQFVEVRTALADAASRSGGGGGRQFGRLQRDTWMRMVHAQFF